MELEGSNPWLSDSQSNDFRLAPCLFPLPSSPGLLCKKEAHSLLLTGSQEFPFRAGLTISIAVLSPKGSVQASQVNPLPAILRPASQIHLLSFSPLTLVSFLLLVFRPTGSSNASSWSLLVWFFLCFLFWDKSWLGHPKWNLASDFQTSCLGVPPPQAPKAESPASSGHYPLSPYPIGHQILPIPRLHPHGSCPSPCTDILIGFPASLLASFNPYSLEESEASF